MVELPLELEPEGCEAAWMRWALEQQAAGAGGSNAEDVQQQSGGTGKEAAGVALPTLEIRLQGEKVVVGPAHDVPSSAVKADRPGVAGQDGDAGREDVPAYPGQGQGPTAGPWGLRSPGPAKSLAPPMVPLRLSVDIAGACGLQAAVVEAQAWLGGGSAVLGRAHQLGPHPYAMLSLFPGDERLRARVPPLRTPFQVGLRAACLGGAGCILKGMGVACS